MAHPASITWGSCWAHRRRHRSGDRCGGLVECFGRFALKGHGTPVPIAPPENLVVRAFIGTFVIPCTWRWCVPLWDRLCSSAVSCFSSTRELCGSCFTCSCWAMRNQHSGGSLVPHTRRTERTSGGGGRGSHRGRAPAKNDRLSGRGINSVAEQAVELSTIISFRSTVQTEKKSRDSIRFRESVKTAF